MEINIKKIMKLSRILLVVLALTFSKNASATTSTTFASTTFTSVTLNTTSSVANLAIALKWDWLFKWFKPKDKKPKRGGNGANTGGPANQVPGNGHGAGGPGNSYGPGNGAGQGLGPKHNGDKIPLDGGLSILLLGAAAFGIKKLRSKKNDIA